MPIGVVKFYNEAKGTGFITEEGGRDLSFTRSEFQSGDNATLREGLHVEFELDQGSKGPIATNIIAI
jgi:CspA family cold shock protein